MVSKVIFKIPIATNAPLPFIHRFVKNWIHSNKQRLKEQEVFNRAQEIVNKNLKVSLRNLEIQLGQIANQLLEESNVFICSTKIEEVENKEKEDFIEETPIFTKEKLAPKIMFKILIATNAPLILFIGL